MQDPAAFAAVVIRVLNDNGWSVYDTKGGAVVWVDRRRVASTLRAALADGERDSLLGSRELPPLPWSSAADRQPWPNEAADHHRIVDANGRPIFGRNWKEACAAIEYLVRQANRGAA